MTGIATVAPGQDFVPQRMKALQQANRVRLARAALKRQVASGQVNAADVIRSMPWEVCSMPVDELLTSQRRWGVERARRVLATIPVPEKKHIGKMTPRQRDALARALERGPSR